MRVEWDLAGFGLAPEDCAREFAAVADRFHMRWRIEQSDRPPRVAVFVSKYDHCLVDLLYRHQSGELACDFPLVVSNHADARRWADFYDVPFHHIPVAPAQKAAAQRHQLHLPQAHRIALV